MNIIETVQNAQVPEMNWATAKNISYTQYHYGLNAHINGS